MKPLPSVEYLRELFNLDPETGALTWRARAGSDPHTKKLNASLAGKVAGSLGPDGRRRIRIDGRRYYAHRLIWALEKGVCPEGRLDHIRRDGNNAASNLRIATNQQNGRNRWLQTNNTSGYPGVTWEAKRGKWRAEIDADVKRIHLGRFASKEEAATAYRVAALEHFGEFASLEIRDPPSAADESIYLVVADHAGETSEEAIARLGLTGAEIAGREVCVIDTGIHR
jgi:hypothetical protein